MENEEYKICTHCREWYKPKLHGQTMCLKCIMREEPRVGKGTNSDCSGFPNWFIYHWRHIRMAAAQARKGRGEK